MIFWYKHHLKPKHMGGKDTPDNIVRVNLAMHAFLHRCLYEEHNKPEDYLAWRAISGSLSKEEIIKEKQSLGSRKNKGRQHTEEARRNMSKAAKRRVVTEQRLLVLRNNAEIMKTEGHTDETKKKLKEIANDPIVKQKRTRYGSDNGMFGKKHNKLTLNKIKNKARNRQKVLCFVCNKEMSISNYKRWNHGFACQRIKNNG